MSRMRWKRLALIAAVLAAPAAVQAADGRIPIYRQTTIAQPGSYYLTRNFSVAAGPAIAITTPGVDLDLNGHVIEQMSPMSDVIQLVLPSDLSIYPEIKIRNGQLDGGFHGISFMSPTACTFGLTIEISDMAIQQQSEDGVHIENGCTPNAPTFVLEVFNSQIGWVRSGLNLQGVSQLRTEKLNITGLFGPGIVLANISEWIGDSLIIGYPWSDGIRMTNVASARVDSVMISRPTGNGLVIQDSWATTFTDLTIYDPTESGIRVMDSADVNLEQLWITSAAQSGIEVLNSRNVKIIHSVIGSTTGAGIMLDNVDTSHLMYNTIRGSGGAGVLVMGSRAGTLCNNNMSANRVGIDVGGLSEAIALLDNNVSHNIGDGIHVDGLYGSAERNHAARNGGAGIRFGPMAAENVYADNRTRGNTAGGIIVGPLGGNINGGGNL